MSFFLILVVMTTSCRNQHQKEANGIEYYPDGRIKKITSTLKDGNKQTLLFDSVGQYCKQISNLKNGKLDGEQFWFYKNGFLEQKISYKFDTPEGHFYNFYQNGAIKSQRYLSKGLEQKFGIDYYNSDVGIAKSTLYFNNLGKIYFKQNFDSTGVLFNEEGVKPEELK